MILKWHKARRSSQQGACVETARSAACPWHPFECPTGEAAEVRCTPESYLIRHSRFPSAGALPPFTREEWTLFIEAVKGGEFDHLTDAAALDRVIDRPAPAPDARGVVWLGATEFRSMMSRLGAVPMLEEAAAAAGLAGADPAGAYAMERADQLQEEMRAVARESGPTGHLRDGRVLRVIPEGWNPGDIPEGGTDRGGYLRRRGENR